MTIREIETINEVFVDIKYNKQKIVTIFIRYENGEAEYIVSTLVAQACPYRLDLFIPNDSVRDENGNIIGCRSLGRI